MINWILNLKQWESNISIKCVKSIQGWKQLWVRSMGRMHLIQLEKSKIWNLSLRSKLNTSVLTHTTIFSYHSAGSNDKDMESLPVPNPVMYTAFSSEPSELESDFGNIEAAFLRHCTVKYDMLFLSEWTKTINFRIWSMEHCSQIRWQSEYAGYYDDVQIL